MWALLVLGAAIAVYLSRGYFLADDFVQLAQFGHWDAQGRLLEEVQRKFTASIDGVNGFWRPLTYATYALNYAVGGGDARLWLGVNLALHLANAALVGALVDRLAPGEVRAGPSWSALFAGTLFFTLASGAEGVLWISARYDALSTLFTLLAAWWFTGGSRGKAFVAALLALMSKEAGAVALVLVGFLALTRELRTPGATPESVTRGVAASLWPFVALGLAYVALRVAIFGNATNAYVGLAVDLTDARHWRELFWSGLEWSRVTFPGPGAVRGLATLAAAALLALGLAATRRSRARGAAVVAVLASLATALALVLRFLPSFDPSGIGGRLFYLPGALVAMALGLSLASAGRLASPVTARSAGALAALLVTLHLAWFSQAAREYRSAHREMRAIATAVGQAASIPAPGVAVLFIPYALGRVPFGANAQAGLMLPPVQREPVTRRVLVQLEREIPQLPDKVSRGVIDWLARHEIFDLPAGDAPLAGARDIEPSRYSCWSTRERRFKTMAVDPGERHNLVQRLESAYRQASCGDAATPK